MPSAARGRCASGCASVVASKLSTSERPLKAAARIEDIPFRDMLRMLAARTFTVGVPIAEKTSRAVNVPLRR